MYILSGTFSEVPQRTHRWNNTKLTVEKINCFSLTKCVLCAGDSSAIRRTHTFDFRFHAPILGGWKQYVVLAPEDVGHWYIGWISGTEVGVSRIALDGPVRMLLGPDIVSFFGIDAKTGAQVALEEIGSGCIGQKGPYAKNTLL